MSDSARLEATVSDLRNRMMEVGCVFEFTLQGLPIGVQVSESTHRHALERLFESLRQRYAQHRSSMIASDPSLKNLTFFALEFDTSPATATPVNAFEIATDGSSWLARLQQAFIDPPYGSRADAALFAEFCAVVGLESNAEVLDWVGDMDAEPERSAWSNYFDIGKEWWGIWCATIWNPTTRTLAAITASSTD